MIMQISRIQNIFSYNFQYKNNPIKYNPINFKGQDIFERSTADDVVVSKKYYRGEKEIDPNLLMQQGQTLFIKTKDSYVPYNASLKEYNAKGETIRHSFYGNGSKNIVSTYKNDKIIQRDEYKDIYSSIKNAARRTAVVKFDHTEENKPKQTFGISRNYGKDWKNHPTIVMRKNEKDDSLFIYFAAPSDTKRGKIEVNYSQKDNNYCFFSPIYDDEKDYYLIVSPLEATNKTALLALKELRETIQSEEFKADFGFSEKFNSELDKTIDFLSSKLNDED